MAMLHVIVQNTSKELVANKVTKIDSLYCVHLIMYYISRFSFKGQNHISFLKDLCVPGGTNICKNGGSCNVTENGEVSCVCPKEFNGIHCENGNLI